MRPTSVKQAFWIILLLWATSTAFYGSEEKQIHSENSAADAVDVLLPVRNDLPLSLADIPKVVRNQNLRLQADRLRVQEARSRLRGAGRWENPEIEIDYQDSPESIEFSGGIGFNQKFPLTSRLRREKAAAASLLAAAASDFADQERLVIAEAKTVAMEILALKAQKRLRTKQLKIAGELTVFVRKSSAKGEVSLLDAGQASLAEIQLELEIHHLDHDANRIKSRLKSLLGLAPSETLEIEGELPLPGCIAAGTVAVAMRPDYQAALKRAETAAREIQIERLKRWGDVTLGLFVRNSRQEDVPVGFNMEPRIGIRLAVPLPLWNKNEAAVEEKTAKASRLEQTARALEGEILNQAAEASATMAILAVHVGEIQRELLPAARRHLQEVEAAYKKGLVDLRTFLGARKQHVDIEIRLLDAVRDYSLARIRYETATGQLD